jgi:hypothetical protein
LEGFRFQSLLRFRVPLDSLAAAGGSSVSELTIDSLRAVLGWRPSLTFEEGLERTVQWFRRHDHHLIRLYRRRDRAMGKQPSR